MIEFSEKDRKAMSKIVIHEVDPPEETASIPINPENDDEDDANESQQPVKRGRNKKKNPKYPDWEEQLKLDFGEEEDAVRKKKAGDASNKEKKTCFTKLFGELGIDDLSFLLRKKLSVEEKEKKKKLYDFFNLKEEKTDGIVNKDT